MVFGSERQWEICALILREHAQPKRKTWKNWSHFKHNCPAKSDERIEFVQFESKMHDVCKNIKQK